VTSGRANGVSIRRHRPRIVKCLAGAVLALLSAACAAAVRPARPVVTPAGVRFTLIDPSARNVAVAGSFNHWSPSSHLLVRNSAGSWALVVALPPGDYLFMYVVDGTNWVTPPLAEDYVDDGFGSKNGIVIVRDARH